MKGVCPARPRGLPIIPQTASVSPLGKWHWLAPLMDARHSPVPSHGAPWRGVVVTREDMSQPGRSWQGLVGSPSRANRLGLAAREHAQRGPQTLSWALPGWRSLGHASVGLGESHRSVSSGTWQVGAAEPMRTPCPSSLPESGLPWTWACRQMLIQEFTQHAPCHQRRQGASSWPGRGAQSSQLGRNRGRLPGGGSISAGP